MRQDSTNTTQTHNHCKDKKQTNTKKEHDMKTKNKTKKTLFSHQVFDKVSHVAPKVQSIFWSSIDCTVAVDSSMNITFRNMRLQCHIERSWGGFHRVATIFLAAVIPA